MTDIATPVTYKRYTGNHNGTFEGWLIDTTTIDHKIEKTLPGIENLYLCSHWTEIGGGVPLVALGARNLLQIICKKDGRKFTTLTAKAI